ncbi:MAG TPA: hypothetical protein PK855_01650 [Bacteroidales bacterium]|nr:hypothetical protein [Bacteroidales bacterium]
MAHQLSKSTFIRGEQCQKSLYLNKKRPFLRDKISAEQLAKFRRGTDVGILAQSLFPGGVDCRPKSPSQYAAKVIETAQQMADQKVNCIYEAVFQFDDVLIILDILERTGHQWNAYEVKSSKKISETYLQDAALQYHVIRGSGVDLTAFNLIYINENYEMETETVMQQLFLIKDVTAEVKARENSITAAIALSKATLTLENSPEVPIGEQCHHPYPCDFLGHCWKSVPPNSLLYLDTLESALRFSLYREGKTRIEQLPEEHLKNIDQKIQYESFKKNEVNFDKAALHTLSHIPKAAQQGSFLKVLYSQPAVPFMTGMRPYDHIPLAVSILKGNTSTEYLIAQTADGMEFFLQTLDTLNEEHIIFAEDKADVAHCVRVANRISAKAGHKTIHDSLDQLVGLREFLSDISLYLPFTADRFGIEELQKHFSATTFNLKKEVYLVKDLLEETDEVKISRQLEGVGTYVKALQQIVAGFRKLLEA